MRKWKKGLAMLLCAAVVSAGAMPAVSAQTGEESVYSAHSALRAALAAGNIQAAAPWQPVSAGGSGDVKDSWLSTDWLAMQLSSFEESPNAFSQTGVDGALPYIKADEGMPVMLNSNQWESATWWDAAGLLFTAPKAGTLALSAGEFKQIAAAEGHLDGGADAAQNASVAIAKNGVKIWPADADAAIINAETSVEFPNLEIEVAEGDQILIAVRGNVLPDQGCFNNAVLMDPQVQYQADSTTTTSGSGTTQGSTTTSDPQPETTTTEAPIPADNAYEALSKVLETNSWSGSNWKPVSLFFDSTGWEDMVINSKTDEKTFNNSRDDKPGAQPYVAALENYIILEANQWVKNDASGQWWDKAGVMYTAPRAGTITLSSGGDGKIKARDGELAEYDGAVAIYHNDKKVWPLDAEFTKIRAGEDVDFPELTLTVKKGDKIVIAGWSEQPVGNGGWKNGIMVNPQVQYQDGGSANTGEGGYIVYVWAMIALIVSSGAVVVSYKKRGAKQS